MQIAEPQILYVHIYIQYYVCVIIYLFNIHVTKCKRISTINDDSLSLMFLTFGVHISQTQAYTRNPRIGENKFKRRRKKRVCDMRM